MLITNPDDNHKTSFYSQNMNYPTQFKYQLHMIEPTTTNLDRIYGLTDTRHTGPVPVGQKKNPHVSLGIVSNCIAHICLGQNIQLYKLVYLSFLLYIP